MGPEGPLLIIIISSNGSYGALEGPQSPYFSDNYTNNAPIWAHNHGNYCIWAHISYIDKELGALKAPKGATFVDLNHSL